MWKGWGLVLGVFSVSCAEDDGYSDGTGNEQGNTPPANIGDRCTASTGCAGLPGGFCAPAELCTRACNNHQDCGCASGVTTGDIIYYRACNVICNASACVRTCPSGLECAAGSTCTEMTVTNAKLCL